MENMESYTVFDEYIEEIEKLKEENESLKEEIKENKEKQKEETEETNAYIEEIEEELEFYKKIIKDAGNENKIDMLQVELDWKFA